MKLELKHLVPYLPYGLKVFRDTGETSEILELSSGKIMLWQDGYYESFKPILRPLSDLPKNEFISELGRFSERYKFNIDQVSYLFIEKLFKKHFDVYGLIDAGLGIDINTLNK